MIIIGYYFNNTGGWIEYSQNGVITKQDFNNGSEIQQFITLHNLNITYKGCTNC
jgi:hypothetical protein